MKSEAAMALSRDQSNTVHIMSKQTKWMQLTYFYSRFLN